VCNFVVCITKLDVNCESFGTRSFLLYKNIADAHEDTVFARISLLADTIFARIGLLADTVFARISLLVSR